MTKINLPSKIVEASSGQVAISNRGEGGRRQACSERLVLSAAEGSRRVSHI